MVLAETEELLHGHLVGGESKRSADPPIVPLLDLTLCLALAPRFPQVGGQVVQLIRGQDRQRVVVFPSHVANT